MPYHAVSDLLTSNDQTVVTFDVLANDTMPQRGALLVSAIARPGALSLVKIVDNRIVYDLTAYDALRQGETITIVIDYVAIGGGPGSGNLNTDTSTLTITIVGQTLSKTWYDNNNVGFFKAQTADYWTIYGLQGDDDLAGGALSDTIYGEAGNDKLRGNGGDDLLIGGAGDDSMTGLSGSDRMIGGSGNDCYYLDDLGDIVEEAAGEGLDRVTSTISYTLGANVENLNLYGPEAMQGRGNELDNHILGNEVANELHGLEGNDRLNGKGGADVMVGGKGNDIYFVDDQADVVVEIAAQGTDTVRSSADYILLADVERLVLTGNAASSGVGNTLHNRLTGNDAANRLEGRAGHDILKGSGGDDVLLGGAGADRLAGGAGADIFAFGEGDSSKGSIDRISDFSSLDGDRIDLSAIDVSAGVKGDQSFHFVGANAFTGAAGELRVVGGDGHWQVFGDADGDCVADLTIIVASPDQDILSATDFIF